MTVLLMFLLKISSNRTFPFLQSAFPDISDFRNSALRLEIKLSEDLVQYFIELLLHIPLVGPQDNQSLRSRRHLHRIVFFKIAYLNATPRGCK